MLAMRVNFPSLAPADMVATRGTSGEVSLKGFFHGFDDFGDEREGGTVTAGSDFPSAPSWGTRGDRYFRVGGDPFQRFADVFGIFAGEDAAVHVGTGGLRQGVGGVAAGEHGGYAGGAEQGIEIGVRETGGRRRPGRAGPARRLSNRRGNRRG